MTWLRRATAILVPTLIVVALIVAWRVGYFDATKLSTIRAVIRETREIPFAPALYIFSYALAVVLLLPTTVLSLVGGALFGMPGFLFTWLGAMLGSSGAYSLGRYTGRSMVRRFLGKRAMLQRLRDDASVRDLMRLRLLPVAPFGVLDYLAGMSGIKLRTLLLASGTAILPTKAAYVFAGRQLAGALEGGPSATGALVLAGSVSAGLALVAVTPTLARIMRRRARLRSMRRKAG